MKLLSGHPFFAPRIDGMGIDATNDIVFVDSIRVQAKIGHDCWDPMYISMYLLLKESYLDIAGKSDNLSDSIDYGDLAEKVRTFIKEKSESESPSFGSTDDLIQAVSERAFDLAKGAAAAVRVTIGAPKLMLPAGFSVDIITSTPTVIASKWVLIEDLILLVIIGVNSAERESKQQVIVNLLFEENTSPLSSPSSTVVNYQEVVAQLCEASFKSLFDQWLCLTSDITGNKINELSNARSFRDPCP